MEVNEIVHHNLWGYSVNITDAVSDNDLDGEDSQSSLFSLNLSHNAFKSIPAGLSCFAIRLSRLNMSYNQLTDMSFVGSFPSSLKQLDLSYNQIKCWMTLKRRDPDLTGLIAETVSGNVTCYNPKDLMDQKLLSPLGAPPGESFISCSCKHPPSFTLNVIQ